MKIIGNILSLPGVYKFTNILNKKIYIGSTYQKKGVIGRLNSHLSLLRRNKHPNKYFQNTYNLYGESVFEFEVILYCSKERCIFFEQKCIDTYKSFCPEYGYNENRLAGNGLFKKHSKETKIKMSQSHNGNKSHMYGKKLSQITRKKISETRHKLNIGKGKNHPLYGKKHSTETKLKISLSRTGIKHTEETKIKMRKNNFHIMKSIERIDSKTGEIKEYLCIQDAIKEGFNRYRILLCCRNLQEQHRGYFWKYINKE